jgi:hypothetical protein
VRLGSRRCWPNNDGKLAGKAMKDLSHATRSTFANVRFVLTDMTKPSPIGGGCQLALTMSWSGFSALA